MAGERGPKDEPSFDTQALLGVSDAELHETRGRRAPRRSPKGLIAAAVGGVLVVTVGLVLATRGGPEVVKLGPPDASASPQAAGALPSATPTPSASGAPASVEPAPDPRASLPPVVVPVAETEPTRAPRTTRDREAREREAPASKGSRVSGRPTGPDDVDRAMERLAKQTGDQHAAAGALEAARAAYAEECAAGRGSSCTRWGALLVDGRGGARDEGGARDAFGQACRLRSPEGCLALARASEGRAALEALESACDLASAAGCRGAAEYVRDSGGPEARVISLRARACALGDPASCDDGARTSTTR
jgi:hypothetical protein